MKNKTLALKLLAKDCEIDAVYIQDGKTCAIGCLAIASGASKKTLKRFNDYLIRVLELTPVRERIRKKFGLTDYELSKIQSANDGFETVKERRRNVLRVVRNISVTPKRTLAG